MLSIVILFRNAVPMAQMCLEAMVRAVEMLRLRDGVEYLLLDDHSESGSGMIDFLKQFRDRCAGKATLVRFKTHQHYTQGLAYGFSLARGGDVLFVSHDMAITSHCLRVMLEVAAMDEGVGIVRPSSAHMDLSDGMEIEPTFAMRMLKDVEDFSRLAARYHGTGVVENVILIGDAMLVKRAVIEKIGVPDPRFHGFMGDVDYGLRAQRAGFRIVTARGAWLHHEGAGYMKGLPPAEQQAAAERHLRESVAAAKVFKQKWDAALPEKISAEDMQRLVKLERAGVDYQPPLRLDPDVCEIL